LTAAEFGHETNAIKGTVMANKTLLLLDGDTADSYGAHFLRSDFEGKSFFVDPTDIASANDRVGLALPLKPGQSIEEQAVVILGNDPTDSFFSVRLFNLSATQASATPGNAHTIPMRTKFGAEQVTLNGNTAIVVFGGQSESEMNDVWSSTDEGVHWTQVGVLPQPCVNVASAGLPNGAIVVVGCESNLMSSASMVSFNGG